MSTEPTSIADAALAILEAFLEKERPGFASDKRLHDEARALSIAYTATDEVRTFSNDAASTLAYLAHFGPRAVAAVSHALAFARVPPMCIDVGAGSGASALALVVAGARKLTLVDTSAPALAMAKKLLSFASGRVAGGVEVRTVVAAVSAPATAKSAEHAIDREAALLLSAFAFGELEGEPGDALAALGRCAPNAKALVIVDAGDRPRARRLQTARDALVNSEVVHDLRARGLVVRAPCGHVEPCPALVRERDWCHARIAKDLPDKLARFARAVGRDDERMAASFLVLDDHPRESDGIVVIGDAHKEKGRVRLPVCGPGGLRFLQALKRDRKAHDALLDVPRGSRLPLAAAGDAREGTGHVVDPALLSSRA